MPVLTVALVILSAFPVFDDLSSSVIELIDGYLVPQGADAVHGYLATFQSNAGNLTAIGIVFLGVTAVMLIRTIDQTFNRIWRAQNRRPLWTQFLVYWMLLTFAPLAVGAGLSVWELLLRHQEWANQDTRLSDGIKTAGGLVMNAAGALAAVPRGAQPLCPRTPRADRCRADRRAARFGSTRVWLVCRHVQQLYIDLRCVCRHPRIPHLAEPAVDACCSPARC